MSDQWMPVSHEDPAAIAETITPRKLATEWGGTGVSATDTADLLDQLGVVDATGATDVADGAAGLVPMPPLGKQRQALRGDMTYSTELEVSKITDASGTAVIDVYALGDKGCRPYMAAANASGQQSRVGADGSPLHIDFAIEPKGYGRLTRNGDPIPQTIKPTRRLQAIPFAATFETIGLTAPTISTPGGAATTIQNTDGSFVRIYNDASASRAPAVIDFGYVTQRRWDPEVVASLWGLVTSGRIWFGLFSASPSGLNHLDDADVKTPVNGLATIASASVEVTTGVFENCFTDSANGFVSSGIRVGDVISVTGFSDSSLNITYDVREVNAGYIRTVPTPSVTEAAPASVTFTNKKHVHTSTSVVSVTSASGAGYYTRSSGDFVADGWAVGDFVSASGFANAGNNVVSYVSAVTTTQLTTTTTLVTESSPGTPVTLRRVIKGVGFRYTVSLDGNTFRFITSDGATQTETDTGKVVDGVGRNRLRFRHIGSGQWDAAVWNSTTNAWEWSAPQSGGPGASDSLKLIALVDSLQDTSDRNLNVQVIDLFQD